MITLYDTSLSRDGRIKAAGLSVDEQLQALKSLDANGVAFIELSLPGPSSNDISLYQQAMMLALEHANISIFADIGDMTSVSTEDQRLAALAQAPAIVVTLAGPSCPEQLERLGLEPDQNLRQIDAVVRHLQVAGKHVFFEAAEFFAGYKSDASYALATLLVAHQAGAEALVLDGSDGNITQGQAYEATKATIDSLAAAGIETVVGIRSQGTAGLAAVDAMEAVRAGAQLVIGSFVSIGQAAKPVQGLPDSSAQGQTANGRQNLAVGQSLTAGQDTAEQDAAAGRLAAAALAADGPAATVAPPASFSTSSPSTSSPANFSKRIAELGLTLPSDSANQQALLKFIRGREDLGYDYHQADASLALLLRLNAGGKPVFEQESFRVIDELHEGGKVRSEATVKLVLGGWRHVVTAEGDTALEAMDSALRTALKPNFPQVEQLLLTGRELSHLGTICRVTLQMSDGSSSWGAIGIGSSPTQATWEALVDAVSFGLLKNQI